MTEATGEKKPAQGGWVHEAGGVPPYLTTEMAWAAEGCLVDIYDGDRYGLVVEIYSAMERARLLSNAPGNNPEHVVHYGEAVLPKAL